MGLVDCPWVIADEPGAWENTGGQLMNDGARNGVGQAGVTHAGPVHWDAGRRCATGPGHWWYDLVNGGNTDDTVVEFYQGAAETWDKWPTIRRANPLTAVSPEFRRQLLKERDAARGDSRLKARFLSYRLNLPAADESTMLLDIDDWQRSQWRPPGAREGSPIFAVDLGGGRAWSACVAIWQSGLIDAVALAPGIPDLRDQEKRDGVPAGLYQKLADRGALALAHGLRVQPPGDLMDFAVSRFGAPEFILCDRFRLNDLLDWNETHRIPILPRVTRWSEASEDIRALRKLSKDGPLSVSPDAATLIGASLAVARVKSDDAGSMRLVKRGTNNQSRDDVAAALTLVAGAYERARGKWVSESVPYVGMVNP